MRHMQTIAVENNLQPVKEALEAQGFKTVDMREARKADCLVISGMDENVMGMEDIQVNVPVISAQGKTPKDIVSDVKSYFK